MSLKIPILLPSVWLFNISFMSPNAPPDESERVYGAFYERICPAMFPILHRLSASLPCIAELAVVLAVNYPSTFSSKVLSWLVLSGKLPTSNVNRCFFVGGVIAAIGGLGRLWCFRAMGRHFTHQLAVRKDHRLVTTGPYAIIRHPGYLFGQLSALGMSLMIASPGSFTLRCGWLETTLGRFVIGVWAMQNVLGWVLSYARCQSEDALLREHFREEWDGYSQRVRYRMIPGVY
ncbi:hypothetical protein J3R83DRAFT_11029 [Lanmaoa asiatica]|nr:hypothetical protein J3R83DRAFT_11029 [Lanmaoa asiatica]